MKNVLNTKKTEDLLKVILALRNLSEAKKFFRDLLTEKELIEFGNRWKAVKMLNKKITYVEIVKETGLSSRTVARISNWFKKGKGGYKLMLEKLNRHHNLSLSGKRLC